MCGVGEGIKELGKYAPGWVRKSLPSEGALEYVFLRVLIQNKEAAQVSMELLGFCVKPIGVTKDETLGLGLGFTHMLNLTD